jgi:hypothetical protein
VADKTKFLTAHPEASINISMGKVTDEMPNGYANCSVDEVDSDEANEVICLIQ